MNAGKLRHRVVFQKPVVGTDPFQTNTAGRWDDVVTCWAGIETTDPRVVYTQGSQNMQVSHIITIRYPGKDHVIGSGYQVLYGTRVFSIVKGITNEAERNRSLVFLAWEINPSAGG
jgi:SPP1 family predicted phage head-tail adaptor